MKKFFCLILLFSFLSCRKEYRVYFFKRPFYTTPGIKCDEIKTTFGVYMLEMDDNDFLLKCFSAFKKYENLISSYSNDYRIRIEFDNRIICSDLDLLMDLKDEINEENYALFVRLKKLISEKEKDAIQIVPFPIPVGSDLK